MISKFYSLTKVWSLFICIVSKVKSLISSVPNCFNNTETPIICYKYNKPIRSTILNFNKITTDMNIDSNTPGSRDCQNFIYL